MAAASGITVSNLYLYQPLLPEIARDLGAPEHLTALVPFATQLGYGLGVLLIVPLVDMANPPTLLRWLLALTTVGVIAAAAAPSMSLLLAATVAFSFVTVVPQIMLPLGASLVPPDRRGRVLGTLAIGGVLGIMLSRTGAGLVAETTGTWRAPYLVTAALTGALFFVLPRFLPATGGVHGRRYRDLLRSLPSFLKLRDLRLSMGLGACMFGAFGVLWTTLAFHLGSPAFGFGPAMAGLFGLFGAPGALAAPMVGRLVDRWGTVRINALSLTAGGACFLVAGTWGQTSLLALIVAVNLLDLGLQSGQVTNRTRIFGLGDGIRGRVNSLYIVTQFIGAAVAALASGIAWASYGWSGVCVLGGSLVGIAAVLLAVASVRADPGP